MARRRIFVDKTEMVAGYVSGKKFITQNITYDKITSIRVKQMKRPGLLGFGRTCAAIEILLRGADRPLVYYEAEEKEFFGPYKKELEQFAKDNRIVFVDETK